MSRQNNRFDAVRVSSACSSSWDAMSGTAQKKFCSGCNKHVYDFSQLSRKEADAIMEASHGNLCARISRTTDGEILTKEPLSILPVRIQTRRTSPVANALLATVLGMTPVATSIVSTPVSAATYSSKTSKQYSDVESGTASISGAVTDPQTAMIQGATVILSQDSSEIQMTKTNDRGTYSIQNLSAGIFTLTINYSGFKTTVVQEIQITEGEQKIQNVQMQNGAVEYVTVGMSIAPPATLRTRYINSPLIIDAVVGKSSVAEVDKNTRLMRTELHINSFLKGFQAKNVITYYHNVYEGEEATIKEGDLVLAFLTPAEKGKDGFLASQYDKGIQVLSHGEMQTYSARIRELRNLMSQRNPTPEEITEWLVRCAEEPVTRWDGAQELLSGFENLENRLQEIEECKKEGKSLPALKSESEFLSTLKEIQILPQAEPDPDGKFAEALSESQKNILSQTLFSIRKFSDDDLRLLQLVMKWDKEKSIPFAINLLKQEWSEAFDPTYVLVEMLNDHLDDETDDETFNDLVSEFQNIKIREKDEGDDEKLSPEDRAALLESDKKVHTLQKNVLQKIIDAAEMKLRTSNQ